MSTRPILVVEDSADDRELMIRALKKCRPSQEVIAMADGVEALSRLIPSPSPSASVRPLRPALLLLDLKMPRMSGFEVLKKLRANPETQLLPIVMLTSSTDAQDLARAYAAGVNGYVVKPVEFDRFVRVIQSVCDYWIDCDALNAS